MDWLQLMAQGFQESSLNHKAKSPYGAVGIMQVLPSTAKWLGVNNYMEVEGNISAGAKYMDRLLKRYAKDQRLPGTTGSSLPLPPTMRAPVVLENTKNAP